MYIDCHSNRNKGKKYFSLLPPCGHPLYYNVGVTGTGPNDHSAEITYDLKVK